MSLRARIFAPLFLMLLVPATHAHAQVLYTQSFDGLWSTPPEIGWDCYSGGDAEWHRNDYTSGWTSGNGAYSPTGAKCSAYSARFHTYDVPAGTHGELVSPYFDFSGYYSEKFVTFSYINSSGTDSLLVSVSTDYGYTWSAPIVRLGSTGGWTPVSVSMGTSAWYGVRLKFDAVSDHGTSDIGIDEVSVTNGPATIAGGTYQVGADQAVLRTLADVANQLNSSTLTGNVTYELNASYDGTTECLPIVLNQVATSGGSWSITIRPRAGVSTRTTSGSSANAVIRLNGADRITLDGRAGGVGSTRAWTISNTSTAGATAAVWLSSQGSGLGATNNTLQYLTLSCGADMTTSTAETFGILASGGSISTGSDGLDNDANAILSCAVTRARWGIYLRGSSTNTNDACSITGNLVGPVAFGADQIVRGGIVVQHQNAVTIAQNEVRFVGQRVTDLATGVDVIGIGVGANTWLPTASAVTAASVTRNLVHDVVSEKTFSAVGILLASSSASSGNTVANNIAFNVRANGTAGDQAVGLGVAAGSGDKVAFNTVAVTGDQDPPGTTAATQSAVALRIASSSVTNLTCRNNVLSVGASSNTGTLLHFAIVAPSAYAWGTGACNNNDVWPDAVSAQATLGGIGTSVPYTAVTTLAAWQTQFSPPQDAASLSQAPPFTSTTDLHLLTTVPTRLESGGASLAGLTTDYDGQTRATPPDIGADEGTFTPYTTDMTPLALVDPASGGSKQAGTAFSPSASFRNAGTVSLSGVPVRYQILQGGTTLVYNQTATIASLTSGASALVTFPSVSLATAGSYTMKARAELPGDTTPFNDSLVGTFSVTALNHPPTIRDLPSGIVRRNRPFVLTPHASDPDHDPLTWSAVGLPSGASVNGSTGVFQWTPLCGQGQFTVTLTVSDGRGGTDATSFTVTVLPDFLSATDTYVPPAWVPHFRWDSDRDSNYIEDRLEAGNPTDSVTVMLYLNKPCLAPPDRDSIRAHGRILAEPHLLSVVGIRVQRSALDTIATYPYASALTMNHHFVAALDTTVRAVRVIGSSTYSPNTITEQFPEWNGTGVTIGFIDSGIDDGLHESLPSTRFIGGASYVSGDGFMTAPDNPSDLDGHGTFNAGIVMGEGTPVTHLHRGIAMGVVGYDVRVMHIDPPTGNHVADEIDLVSAIDHCKTQLGSGAILYIGLEGMDTRLADGSFYDPTGTYDGTDAVSSAIDAAADAGMTVVVPAGNNGPANTTLFPPATSARAIVVGASAHMGTVTTDDDQVWMHTSVNQNSLPPQKPDLFAPGAELPDAPAAYGEGITSALYGTTNEYEPGTGTSAAAAVVAGVAAILQQSVVPYAGTAPDDMRNAVLRAVQRRGSDPTADPLYDKVWARGLIDPFPMIDSVTPQSDYGFQQPCHGGGGGNWYLSGDLYPLTWLYAGVPTTIRCRVTNFGPRTVKGYRVSVRYVPFGNLSSEAVIRDTTLTQALLPGQTLDIDSPWTPPDVGHHCLHAVLWTVAGDPPLGQFLAVGDSVPTFALDTNTANNCAWHNIDVEPTGSPAIFSLRIANTLPEAAQVTLHTNVLRGAGWTVACSESTMTFPMGLRECPRDVLFFLTPGPGATDSFLVAVTATGQGSCGSDDLGGAELYAYVSQQTRVEEGPALGHGLGLAPRVFARDVKIAFLIDEPEKLSIQVFDALGRNVRGIDLGRRSAGLVTSAWDGTTRSGAIAPAGLYFIRVMGEKTHLSGRVTRVR